MKTDEQQFVIKCVKCGEEKDKIEICYPRYDTDEEMDLLDKSKPTCQECVEKMGGFID